MPAVFWINNKTGKFPLFNECRNGFEIKRKAECENMI
jgi:hypothetical protein